MARPLRIEFEGAWYHVMNRGAGRRAIFKTDADRRYFLKLLEAVSERFNVEIHAYCLMGNHYHLMLRTPEGNLGRLMRHLNGLYTQWHNRLGGQDGPLFRGRYKAVLVEAEVYWTHLSRYIHRNPLEAGMVRKLAAYPWSSYPAYIGESSAPGWLHTRYLLGALGGKSAYRRFVEGKGSTSELEAFYGKARHSPILGTERYQERIAKGLPPLRDVPDSRTIHKRPSLNKILGAVANRYAVSQASLRISTRGRGVKSPARAMAMYLCQEVAGMRLNEIAQAFALSGYASAGAAIRNMRKRLGEGEGGLQRDLNYILQDLTP
ncbi:MAG TPA: transposase [Gammaproteobacteria bacterium]|nr:transposase [Gammaproteobacteria bacterium]